MPRIRFHIAVLLFLLISLWSSADPVRLSFTEKSYAGDSVFVYGYADYITLSNLCLAGAKADENGHLECTIEINQVTEIWIPLGIYKLVVFVEPGKDYVFDVPAKKPLSVDDELNPFFAPLQILPVIEGADSTELNSVILSLEFDYEKYISKNYGSLYNFANKHKVDSFIRLINNKYSDVKHPYFNVYRDYKMILLKFLTYERDESFIIFNYFNKKPVWSGNVAYMEVFRLIFSDWLSRYSVTTPGARIFNDIARATSPSALKTTIFKNPAVSSDTLAYWIMLKGLHDAFYVNQKTNFQQFPVAQVIMTLDSIKCCSGSPEMKSVASNIYEKATRVIAGKTAPSETFLDPDSLNLPLTSFKGKYLYLVFMDIRSYTARQELSMLKEISEKYAGQMEVLVVFFGDNPTAVRKLKERHQIPFQLASVISPEKTKKLWGIQALTVCYLIDPYGKISLSPAPGPGENFDAAYKKVLEIRD